MGDKIEGRLEGIGSQVNWVALGRESQEKRHRVKEARESSIRPEELT